jgi:nitronate monooxygenase
VQGSEAGGHGRPGRGLLSLLPAVTERVRDVPVVAAGGIATGRQLAACWQLGAAGVALGTRLYASQEALDSAAAKTRLTELGGGDTVHTSVFDVVRGPRWPAGYTGRAAVNSLVARWHDDLDGLKGGDLDRVRQSYEQATEAGDLDERVLWAGEAVDHIDTIEPAGLLIARIHEAALQA